MTQTLRIRRAVRFATLALIVVVSPACRKQAAATPQIAAAPVQKTAAVGGPSASVAKPPDASPEAKRPGPRPPSAPCIDVPGGRGASLPDLLEQAAHAFEKGRYEDALECAREANRIDENSVAAHHFRGAALAELGHIEEARTAYARALALDPDDPEVLRSVADLHVRRLGSRDDLELALQYVRRALPRAQRGKDKPLLKELYLLQAMALDDLGRPSDALAASNRSLEYDAKDREARREKAVALFELCHFDQAKAELSKLAAEEPDAWAEHYLGLIAERAQDDVAAAEHFARAQKLDPDAFKSGTPAPTSVFQRIVQEEVEKLPPDVKQGLAHANFAVEDLPEVSDLVATDPPLSPGILGLFRPPAETAPQEARPTILLYRRNLSRAAHTEEELHREVRDTLMHEVGHLNGEDDEQLRDRGL
jgi:Flp pilus assembly protein TadD/predicted Zn-dependent protease with MMP-like domain